jgi:hypoxia up-regulated 1
MMAVDLGSEFLKVSLIKPGKTPIAVVVNEMSKRKTPALVGFVGEERLLGEEAFSFSVRYPETTFYRSRDMLGRSADHPTLKKVISEHGLPYKIVPHPNRSVACVQIKEGVIHSAEELVVSFGHPTSKE